MKDRCVPFTTSSAGSSLASTRMSVGVTWGRSSTGWTSLKTHQGLVSRFEHRRCGIGIVGLDFPQGVGIGRLAVVTG